MRSMQSTSEVAKAEVLLGSPIARTKPDAPMNTMLLFVCLFVNPEPLFSLELELAVVNVLLTFSY